jgi:hypothetical protein
MSQYELHIQCKACREGRHLDCLEKVNQNQISILIKCTCNKCKKSVVNYE